MHDEVTAEKIAGLALDVVRWKLDERAEQGGDAFVAALGVATADGVTFVEVVAPIERVAIREMIGSLCEERGVVGFAYVAHTTEAEEESGVVGETLVVSAMTRDGRIRKLYEMTAGKIADEPKCVSTVFLTWVFDGIWEVMQ